MSINNEAVWKSLWWLGATLLVIVLLSLLAVYRGRFFYSLQENRSRHFRGANTPARVLDDVEVNQMLRRCGRMFQSGDLSGAEVLLEKLLRYEPLNRPALELQGIIAMEQREFQKAEHYWRRILRIDPEAVGIWNALGVALMGQGRLEEGTEVFLAAWRKGQYRAEASVSAIQLAMGYCLQKDKENALYFLARSAERLGPELLPMLSVPAFDFLRDTPEFQSLLAELRRNGTGPLPNVDAVAEEEHGNE